MKTISLKSAQSKKFDVASLSYLQEECKAGIQQITDNTKNLEDSAWLTNGKPGKEVEFYLSAEDETGKLTKINYTDAYKNEFEGYISYYRVKWNSDKNDWYVYGEIFVRPLVINYEENDENIDLSKLFGGNQLTVHRKKLTLASDGSNLQRPSTKAINHLLVKKQ